MAFLSSLLLLGLHFYLCLCQVPDPSYYLLISMDGFRWDYLDIVNDREIPTPNFASLISTGVRAEYIKNAYVTVTWPNHWTMATGMHVESHGVVANSYFDARLNATFSGRSTVESKWYDNGTVGSGGEPIWVTYQRAASYHRSGMVIWPGGNAEVNGVKATYRVPNDNSMPFKERVDNIIKWFTMEEEAAHLGILYFGEPDQTGHDYGPFSEEVQNMILELDATLGYLVQRLTETKIYDKTNIVLTSDHGMNEVLETYKLSDYINPDWYRLSGGATPGSLVIPKPGYEAHVYQALQKIPNSKVYWKEEIPRKFYYTYNERITPILLMMNLGYMVCCQHGGNSTVPVGDHGYSNEEPSMHPFFIAHGPAFKSGYTSPAFNNTDIYPLLCHLLGIAPHPNNGSLENIKHILQEDEECNWVLLVYSEPVYCVFGFLFILLAYVLLYSAWSGHSTLDWERWNTVTNTADNKPLLLVTMGEDMLIKDRNKTLMS